MAKTYTFFLLDCDGTLFDFNRAEEAALRQVFRELNLAYRPEYGDLYHRINDACWKALERGEITKPALQKKRFVDFGDALPIASFPAEQAGVLYMERLGDYSFLLPGASEVCQALSASKQLYFITNGVEKTQRNRLQRSDIKDYPIEMFVSEAVGVAKPDPRYFRYVFEHIPNFRPEEALVVGDSWTSDILGGIRAGVDTCWVNPTGEAAPQGMSATYEIRSIRELLTLCR
jgi:2-haloacid dehalogenase